MLAIPISLSNVFKLALMYLGSKNDRSLLVFTVEPYDRYYILCSNIEILKNWFA